jgi:outer membrane protein TolC
MKACARPLLAVVAVALIAAASPVRAEVVTLSQLERLAVQSRPALDADAASVRAAAADVEKAEAAYNPTLALRAETGIAPGRELVELPNGVLVSGSRPLDDGSAFAPDLRSELSLQLRANLYDFGRTASSVEASRSRKVSKQAASAVTAQALTMAVRAAYLRWLGSSELLRLSAKSVADATARTARVQALIDEGVRPASDLSPASADEALARLEHARALGSRQSSELELSHAVGHPLPTGAEPDRSLLERVAATAPAAASASAPAADPALHALELERQALQASVRAAEKTDAAVLSGSASAGIAAQGIEHIKPFPAYAVGVGLSVPLWDGGASSAAASATRAQVAALDARMREHEQAQRDAHAQARLQADSAAALVRAAQVLLGACEKRLHEAEEAYTLGAGGIDAVAAARAGLRRAETELVLASLEVARAALLP